MLMEKERVEGEGEISSFVHLQPRRAILAQEEDLMLEALVDGIHRALTIIAKLLEEISGFVYVRVWFEGRFHLDSSLMGSNPVPQ